MTPARKRNLIRAPLVFLVRVPLVLLFFLLSIIGEWSDAAIDWIDDIVPGFEVE